MTGLVIALLLGASAAEAKHSKFIGGHPIAVRYGGGYCYLEAPHLHAYAPEHQALYQQVDDQNVFTGDPTPFGYEGDKHTFYGHHPVITVGTEPVFCFIDGPHHHPFEPPDAPEYKMKKGVAFYVGPVPAPVLKIRPQRQRAINAEYRPYVALRPTVEVEPPPEWQGEPWVAPSVTVQGPAATVQVGAPGVVVAPPAPPSVQVTAPGVYVAPPAPPRVQVTAPGVYVAPPSGRVVVHSPGVFVAPPAPPRVRVTAPGVFVAPPSVHVGGPSVHVGGPGVYVAPPGGSVRVKFKGDRGRHKGWYK
jgi:hypothetical protein